MFTKHLTLVLLNKRKTQTQIGYGHCHLFGFYFLLLFDCKWWMTSLPKIMLGTFSRKMLENISFIRLIFCKIHGIRRDRANNFRFYFDSFFFLLTSVDFAVNSSMSWYNSKKELYFKFNVLNVAVRSWSTSSTLLFLL